ARVWKKLRQQEAGHDAHERRHGDEPRRRRLQAEEPALSRLDREREQNRGKAREDADDDRERQEQLILAEPNALRQGGETARRHRSDAPCARAISTSARSSGVPPGQTLPAVSSAAAIVPIPSRMLTSSCERRGRASRSRSASRSARRAVSASPGGASDDRAVAHAWS